MRKFIFVGAYALIGLLTFGHVYNVSYEPILSCGAKPEYKQYEAWNSWWDCKINNIGKGSWALPAFKGAYAGAFWPVYWSAKLSIEVTK